MLVASIASLFALSVPGSEAPPRLVDAPLLDYYSRALSAASRGEPHKALAMLELLLLPRETAVVIDYDSLPTGMRWQFRRGVEHGIALWREALGADFPFTLSSGHSNAAVRLRFVERIPGTTAHNKGELKTTRRIQWNQDVHYVEFTGTISVTKHSFDGAFMEEMEVAHVVAHEIGHALGLADSEDVERIMGPVLIGNPYARLHPEEVSAVMNFRALLRAQVERITAQTSASEGVTLSPREAALVQP